MKKKIVQLLNNYKEEIHEIEQANLNEFSVVEAGIKSSRKYLQSLRILLRNEAFENEQDEILFFKKQKPLIYGRLKFYAKLHYFLSHKPLGTIKSQKAYIDTEIKQLQTYFQKNLDFVKYYRNGEDFLDTFYFLRGNDDLKLTLDTSHFYTDPEFSTSHDNAVARIIAYDLLLNHYTEELNGLRHNPLQDNPLKRHYKSLGLGWTANKIDLIELIYALQSSGAIKGGRAEIKEMAMACEQIFNVDLGNYYRKFLEIRNRKAEPTKFINRMKASLLKRMQEADD